MSPTMLGPIGLGTAPLGGLFEATDDATARATVERAWQLGLRYFDTAPLYGLGLAERRLGEALRRQKREDYFISTKVGRLLRPGTPDPTFKGTAPLAAVFDFSADGLRRSLAESLERLELDYVDMVLVHDPDEHLDQAIASLDALRPVTRAVGVGTNNVDTALNFVRRAEIDQLLIAGRYTPLDTRAGDSLLALCAERRITVVAGGVFNSGLLSGGTTYDYHAAPAPLVERTKRLAAVCARHDVPLAALAIQFPLRHPAISSILVGARSPAEIEEDLDLLSFPIPAELWNEPLIAEAEPR